MEKIWAMIKNSFSSEFPKEEGSEASDAILLMNVNNPTMAAFAASKSSEHQEMENKDGK